MTYFDKYGVEFSDDRKTLVKCPKDFQGEYLIPDGVSHIDKWAFAECPNLRNVLIPDSVTGIGFCAFYKCSLLQSVIIPHSVTRVEDSAFDECASLLSIELSNGVEHIGDGAFQYCSRIMKVTIPSSVTRIGVCAFRGCTSLKEITVAIDNPNYSSVDGVLLNKKQSKIVQYPGGRQGAYTIPCHVECVGKWAFSDCSGLTDVIIPDCVTSIDLGAFSNCTSLSSLTIPNSVTNIDSHAFSNCKKLKDVIIGDNVTRIGWCLFANCSQLKNIYIPINQEERFCQMEGLKVYASIIRKTSEKQKDLLRQREEQQQQRLQEQQFQELLQDSILFFDTETTGTPRNYKAPVSDSYNWPRLVQLAWLMVDKSGHALKQKSVIIKPDGFSIPSDASAVHGIATERAQRDGLPLSEVLEEFVTDLSFAEKVVGHNLDFDRHIVGAELYRLGMDHNALMTKPAICTMKSSTDFCAIPSNSVYGGYKWPSLQELYRKLFNRDFTDAHDALADITATKECFFELKRRGIIQ